MARGGKREGAGRKAGSQTKRTQEIVKKASADGITPLEVMLTAMRMAWDAQKIDEAVAVARDAAPYMHPRLASSTVKINDKRSVSDLDTAELVAALHAEGDADGIASQEAGYRKPDPLH